MNIEEVNAAINNNAANFLWVLIASCARQRTLTKWRHNDENVMVNFWTHIILKIETTAFWVPSIWICKENTPCSVSRNALASRLKMKKLENDWANCEPTSIQSKLLFKCQMIVVTSDLTPYVMARGHLVSLYPFRLDRKTTKNIRLNYYPLFRKWAGTLPQKDSSKRGTRPDPREQLIGAW